MAEVSRKIRVPVSKETMFEVITDYASYPKFISTLKEAKVLEKGKNTSIVEFHAQLMKPFQYTLELSEKAPSELTWKMVGGDYMRKNSGRWKLKELGPKEIEATYEIDVELSRFVPGFISKLLLEQSLPQTLSEFSDRAKSLEEKKAKKKTPHA